MVSTASLVVVGTMLSGCLGVVFRGRPQPTVHSGARAGEQEGLGRGQRVVIADFNRAGHRTNAGDAFGAWHSDPGDRTQFCRIRLVDHERVGPQGFGLMLEYDVDSPNPAYGGFWMKITQVAVRAFGAVTFDIKGDAARGFTRQLWMELKDGTRVARFRLEGITASWKRMRIPLREFDGITRLRNVTEFVIVIDDETATVQEGALYLDNVVFEPAG